MHPSVSDCRAQLSSADVLFIGKTLARGSDNPSALVDLLTDDPSRDTILDNPALYHALLHSAELIPVSPRLYFYILVRHTLLKRGLDNRDASDYIAAILAQSADLSRRNREGLGRHVTFYYISEAMEHLACTPRPQRFFLRAHIGNLSLLITSLFEEHLRHRVERRAALRPEAYVAFGIAQYQRLSQHEMSRLFHLEGVFTLLANEFETIRRSLHSMQQQLTFLTEKVVNIPQFDPLNN